MTTSISTFERQALQLVRESCSLPSTDRGQGSAGPSWISCGEDVLNMPAMHQVDLDEELLRETLSDLGHAADLAGTTWQQWESTPASDGNPHVRIAWTWRRS